MSCNSEVSLQEYFVDHKEDADFIAIDLPASLLDKKSVELSDDEKEALESVKKINFLGLQRTDMNQAKIDEESGAINKILNTEQYQTLMKFGFDGVNIVLKYQGDDEVMDEVIVFATHHEKGLALIRVLGDDMKPEKISKLMQSVRKGNLDLDAFKQIGEVINM
ncbi:DUF4252 domain-containing protein [Aquimarina addita]|uniref:DUF4252 domain-containing protein n=2 Tax=Aquimarina addita TaxID=870485 RepID=A0ABP6UQ88_9FLAO